MPRLNGNTWIALTSLGIGMGLGIIFMAGGLKNARDRAATAEKTALVAIERSAGHERAANALRSRNAALEAEYQSQVDATEIWRKRAAAVTVPKPQPPPPDSPTAVAQLHSVGLASTEPNPLGIAMNLQDAGAVRDWGLRIPALESRQIALEGTVKGLDTQVGTLGQQKTVLQGENQELRAANGDLRIAADQFRVAYDESEKAARIEKRMVTLKITGTFVLAGGVGYLIGKNVKF